MPVEVQVQISGGVPAFLLVGLPDKAVGEARERVRAALSAMRDDGSLDGLAVLRALLRAPAEIAGLIAVARHTAVARLALTRAHRGLGRGFGLADFG